MHGLITSKNPINRLGNIVYSAETSTLNFKGNTVVSVSKINIFY